MNLKIDVQDAGQEYRITLAGEIDAYTAPNLKEKFMEIAEQDGVKITIDLTDVSYMDSTGLGVFIALLKASKKHNGSLRFVGVSERLKRLFDITGLTDILNVNSQVEGGVK
ncbi:anti-anti sigma factor [Priestia aryabhattai]|uniref:anti-sigma factor antagonist n=1 Tax=Bacillaceae TaxID=186817 RepID=UPI000BA0A5A0|nr:MULTISPECIES: anti-sigma factor antagonist [Bacillaceae]MBY6024572.1 anti-sigma factor antagonist [Nitratireductor sp. DP7N14-4]OZT10866.1 anti-anti sigma factor [Priestia aryabhattai]TDB48003.1 STAS domain-containing protein [Bacillus sp. CBEL-1]